MRLTKDDKVMLTQMGFTNDDIAQICEAALAKNTVYKLNGKRISADEAVRILGRRVYLSGIGRSAFHWTAARETVNGGVVQFDSSKLFKG